MVRTLRVNKEIFIIKNKALFTKKNARKGNSKNMNSAAAFTLIELLVVITIIAIITAVALPYIQNYIRQSRINKARADLEEIRKALKVYEIKQGEYPSEFLDQLMGRHLDASPVDPWGNLYRVATDSGEVFSPGPDRQPNTYEDIRVRYQPLLALVSVKWVDANNSGEVDSHNTPDYLRLYFSRRLVASSPVVADPGNAFSFFHWTSSHELADSLAWPDLKLDPSERLMSIPLAPGVSKVFAPEEDSIWVADGSGLLDHASAHCLASQAVRITSM